MDTGAIMADKMSDLIEGAHYAHEQWLEEMTEIARIQGEFKRNGWQWNEQVYNDGSPDDCSIAFSMETNPTYLSERVTGDYGWGRFPRLVAWKLAYAALIRDSKASGLESH
jgi:hypothetical protein